MVNCRNQVKKSETIEKRTKINGKLVSILDVHMRIKASSERVNRAEQRAEDKTKNNAHTMVVRTHLHWSLQAGPPFTSFARHKDARRKK